jgi:hypothetical protein
MKFTATTVTQPDPTQQGAQFDAPWRMTKAWLRFSLFVVRSVTALGGGVLAAVLVGSWVPALAGLVLALPLALVAFLLWVFTVRTQNMIYRDDRRPIITDGPTVVFVRDRIETRKGHIEKDAIPVDVGLPPGEAARALRWMKQAGKTSRREVTAGAGISQSAWAKLNKALIDFGILDNGRLTDEVDYLLAQLDDL